MNALQPVAGLYQLIERLKGQAAWNRRKAAETMTDPRTAHECETTAARDEVKAAELAKHAQGNVELIQNIESLIHYIQQSPHQSADRTITKRHLEDASMRLRRELGDETEDSKTEDVRSDAKADSLAAIRAVMDRMESRGELQKQPNGNYLPTKTFPRATEAEINGMLDLRAENESTPAAGVRPQKTETDALTEFISRLVACMKIQNAKNAGTAECAAWISQDREKAIKEALNHVTSGIGMMIIAGVDPLKLLMNWMDAVERSSSTNHQ